MALIFHTPHSSYIGKCSHILLMSFCVKYYAQPTFKFYIIKDMYVISPD
jgi:hypothetical protein